MNSKIMRTEYFLHFLMRRFIQESILICMAGWKTKVHAFEQLQNLISSKEISAFRLLFFGVLNLDKGEYADGFTYIKQAVQTQPESKTPHNAQEELFFLAHACMKIGRYEEALTYFEQLLTEKDSAFGVAAYYQGKGDALSYLNRTDDARKAYRHAYDLLTAKDDTAWAYYLLLDLAYLEYEAGHKQTALANLVNWFDKYPDYDYHDAAYLCAKICCEDNRIDACMNFLQQAFAQAEEKDILQRRFQQEKVFAEICTPATIDVLLLEDSSWLDDYPPLAALRHNPALREIGVRFLNKKHSQTGTASLHEVYNSGYLPQGTLWPGSLFPACQELAGRLVLIAKGPRVLGSRVGSFMEHLEIYCDLESPDKVWLAPQSSFPAILFTELASNGDAITQAIKSLFLAVPSGSRELTGHIRAFSGYLNHLAVPSPYSGAMEPAGPHELDRHFTFSPALDGFVWGAAYQEDPWPDSMAHIRPLLIPDTAKEYRRQIDGGFCRLTRRAIYSRAHVCFEIHNPAANPFYIFDIRYKPNPFPATIERFNQLCGTDYPTDLPADVVAGIYGLGWGSAGYVEGQLAGIPPAQVPFGLEIIAAINANNLSAMNLLKEHYCNTLSADLRRHIASLCINYQWRSLLGFFTLLEQDEKLREDLFDALKYAFPRQKFDDMGEPVGLRIDYGFDEDDDEGDGEEDVDNA